MFHLLIALQTATPGTPGGGPALTEGAVFTAQKNLLAETFLQAGPVVKMVLFLLLVLSVCCWGIIIYKYLTLRRADKNSETFLTFFSNASSLMEVYHASKNIPANPLLEVFESGYLELSRVVSAKSSPGRAEDQGSISLKGIGGVENVNRAMQKAKTRAATFMEKYLTFLATTGSTSPFIGLFGTVWGIMTAFRNIGATGSANLASVAPGIAEALIATAVGLFAAIPAVVAYNYFLQRIHNLSKEMENFSTDLLNLIERHLRKSS